MVPGIGKPEWLLLPLAFLVIVWLTPRGGLLPGAWARVIGKDLQGYLAKSVNTSRRQSQLLVLLSIWLLFGAALASISYSHSEAPKLRNLHGRVLVIDLGLDDLSQELVSMARRLIAASPEVPTAVIAVTSEAFDVVPLTTDQAHLDRYLRVLNPAVMPVAGHIPLRGVERALMLLRRASIVAQQVIVLSDGPPPPPTAVPALAAGISRKIWLVVPESWHGEWQTVADGLNAGLVTEAALDTVLADLEGRHSDAQAGAVSIRQRQDLTPWLTATLLPLWLLLFFRRQLS